MRTLLFCFLHCCRFVAGNAGDAADQLKQLIRELHRAGIEVLLEVRSEKE
jgi:pullulanase/glycogen debranching enzyme